MKLALAAAFAACTILLAHAEAVIIESPNTGQTAAYSSIEWHQLRWLPAQRVFIASITFHNVEYESQDVPREEDRFDFTFPGVTLDDASGVFYATSDSGERIPVASLRHGLLGREVKLAPGARIEVSAHSGKIRARLAATSEPVNGPQWVERR